MFLQGARPTGPEPQVAIRRHYSKPSSSLLLEPLKSPLALRTDFIARERSKLIVTMHRSWLGGDFTARRAHPPGDGDGDGDGAGATTILTSRGKWKGLHPRIEFKDASGLPLFTLKISWWSFTNAWYLELPGGGRGGGHRQGHRIATISCYESSLCRLELDFHLTNNAASAGGLEVATLQILGDEAQVGATQVRWEGRPVALIRKTAEISMSAVTLEYEVEVAAGMDQALASVIAIVLAGHYLSSRA